MRKINLEIKRAKKVVFLLLAVLLLGLIAYFIFHEYSSSHSKTVFTVEGTQYTQDDISKLISYPLSTAVASRDSLTKQAFNYLKREQAAKDLNVQPTSAQMTFIKKTLFSSTTTNKEKSSQWAALLVYDQALQKQLNSPDPSIYQGYSFIFWFGQDLESGPVYTSPDFGNTQLVAQNRAYAQNRANYYYNQLKIGKMTDDQVLAALQNDPKLSFTFPTSAISQSVHFGLDPTQDWKDQVAYPDISKYVDSQSKPGLSPIKTGQLSIVKPGSTEATSTDAYFYVVKLTYVKKIPDDIAKQFAAKLDSMQTKYNGW
jgi:hypothetical protein